MTHKHIFRGLASDPTKARCIECGKLQSNTAPSKLDDILFEHRWRAIADFHEARDGTIPEKTKHQEEAKAAIIKAFMEVVESPDLLKLRKSTGLKLWVDHEELIKRIKEEL